MSRAAATTYPGPGEVLPLARKLARAPDPLAVYERLSDGGRQPHTLLLESADVVTRLAERSFVVAGCAVRATCRGREVRIEGLSANGRALLPWLATRLAPAADVRPAEDHLVASYPPPAVGDEEARLKAPSPTDALRALAFGPRLLARPVPAPLLLAGTFAYDLLEVYEPLPPARSDPLEWADFSLWLPERLVVIDHTRGAATLLSLVIGGADPAAAERRTHDAARAIEALAEAATACPDAAAGAPPGPARPGASPGADADAPQVPLDLSDAEFAAEVERLKRRIVAGDVFQIVPSRTFSAPCGDPLLAYRRLRALNPSPYMFFVRAPEDVLLGASPETAVKVSGEPRTVEIRPIAGTARRGRLGDGSLDLDLDGRLEVELRLDAKELAEHMMLIDLARNDVARVSEPGTRHVPRLLGVDRYSHVMHLVSHVAGTLRADLDALHAYVASMNMGTLTGAPKLRAAQLLREVEATRRGPYGGAVGYLTCEGELDSAIVIRSALVKGGVAHVRAGAGVVYDSDPAAEARETRRKAWAVLRALGAGPDPSEAGA